MAALFAPLMAWATKYIVDLVGIGAALALVLAAFWYVHHLQNDVQVDEARVAALVAQAKTGQANNAAVAEAAAVVTKGASRAAADATTHEDNTHAIAQSAGADAALNPGLNAAGRSGLCRYSSYAGDPACH